MNTLTTLLICLKNISFLMTLGLKLVRFIVVLLPASLNNLSLATEVAEIAKIF